MRGFEPERLAAARRAAGVSQREIARLARVNADTVRRWELGETSPQIDLLNRAAAALGVTIADLVHIPENDRFPGDWRVLRGMTQPMLGAAAGVTTQIVGSIERGEISLSENMARKIAAALEITEAELRESYERARNRGPGESA